MIDKLSDIELVTVSGFPYSLQEIEPLRLLEKAAHILRNNMTKDEYEELAVYINNGWSNALIRMTYYMLEPYTKDDMNERITKYRKVLKEHGLDL